jgi:hypothetical protein
MPIIINDSINPIPDNSPRGLIKTVNALAFAIKQLAGTASWRTPPEKSISSLIVEAVIGASHPGFSSGKYYLHSPLIAATTNSGNANGLASNSLVYFPMFIPKAITIDRLAIRVVGNTNNSLCRLGIYANTSDGLPGNLIIDGGVVDASRTGTKELVINQYLGVGWYWLAANCNQVPNIAVASSMAGSMHFLGFDSPVVTGNSVSYLQSGVTYGSLPVVAPISNLQSRTFIPLVWFRVA